MNSGGCNSNLDPVAISHSVRYYDTTMTLNARQERFINAIVEGKPASEAYRLAGYKSVGGNGSEANASRLIRNDNVAFRLSELRAEAAKRNEITVDLILRELEEARIGALTEGQFSAAVAASLGRAKIAGLIVDRAQIEGVIRKPSRTPTRHQAQPYRMAAALLTEACRDGPAPR